MITLVRYLRRERGTFFDEIDSLSMEQQKSYFFLDSGNYRSVGSSGEKKSNCRLIFSSGQDRTFVKRSLMRKDFISA